MHIAIPYEWCILKVGESAVSCICACQATVARVCAPKGRTTRCCGRRRMAASKIGPVLKSGFSVNAFPIYQCDAAKRQGVRRSLSITVSGERLHGELPM